jgi:hypothetical protein
VEVWVDYATADDTALAGVDYEAAAGTVCVAAGAVTAAITVPTSARAPVSPARAFTVTIRDARAVAGGSTVALGLTTTTATATIQGDPVPVRPTGEGPHDFFDAWVASPAHHSSNSLRSIADIVRVGGKSVLEQWTYDAARDAAHLFRTSYENNPAWGSWNGHQLKFPIAPLVKGRVLVIWDELFSESFRTGCGGQTGVYAYKAMQMMLQGDAGWWTLMHLPGVVYNNVGGKFPPETGYTVTTEFRAPGRVDLLPAGLHSAETVIPAGPGTAAQAPAPGATPMPHSVWVRNWVEIVHLQPPEAFGDWNQTYAVTVQPNPSPLSNGCWHMVSHWMASEISDPVRILYRVPMWMQEAWADAPYLAWMRFELNSSKHGATAPLQVWGRNVIVLKDLVTDDTDTQLFRRPVATPV